MPPHHWNSVANQRAFMDELAKKLNIKSPTDWYKVTRGTFTQYGGDGLLQRYHSSFYKLLSSVYAEYPFL